MAGFYRFLQAVALGPKGAKKTFRVGQHDVPDEIESDPYFLKLVKNGLVTEGVKKPLERSADERNKLLYDRLTKKAAKKPEDVEADAKAKADAEEAELLKMMEAEEKASEADEADEADDDDGEGDDKPEGKGKHKKPKKD